LMYMKLLEKFKKKKISMDLPIYRVKKAIFWALNLSNLPQLWVSLYF
jgi:hypothetical protein